MRTVLFAIQPEVVLLDVAGAGEAFRIAEREVPGSYQLRYVSTQPAVRSAVGLHLDQLEPLPDPVPDNSVIVVTGVTTKALRLDSAPTTALVSWLKRAMENETVTLMAVTRSNKFDSFSALLRRYSWTSEEIVPCLHATATCITTLPVTARGCR